MKNLRTYVQIGLALFSICFLAWSPANALPADSGAATVAAPVPPVDNAAPGAYPAPAADPSSWKPTHFEVMGFAQWRNISSNGTLTTTNNGTIGLGNDLGIGKMAAGPLVRFIW